MAEDLPKAVEKMDISQDKKRVPSILKTNRSVPYHLRGRSQRL